jgi:hypothetical protein
MNLRRLATSALSFALLTGAGAAFAQYGPPPPPPPGYQQGPPPGAWDAPPTEFREYQARGYHDGVIGATKDYQNHRAPTPQNRDEFRHPNFIPGPFRRDYRDGFRKGYYAAVKHLEGGPGPYGPR